MAPAPCARLTQSPASLGAGAFGRQSGNRRSLPAASSMTQARAREKRERARSDEVCECARVSVSIADVGERCLVRAHALWLWLRSERRTRAFLPAEEVPRSQKIRRYSRRVGLAIADLRGERVHVLVPEENAGRAQRLGRRSGPSAVKRGARRGFGDCCSQGRRAVVAVVEPKSGALL